MAKSLIFFTVILIGFVLVMCTPAQYESDHEGYTLAKQYCANCHLLPTPDAHDKKTWAAGVLPKMGAHYGLYEGILRTTLVPDSITQQLIGHVYPENPQIDAATWQLIKDFYVSSAPNKLSASDSNLELKSQNRFKKIPVYNLPELVNNEITTHISFDSIKGIITIGGKYQSGGVMDTYNTNHNLQVRHQTLSSPVQVIDDKVLLIGSLSPSDIPQGKLTGVGDRLLINNLARPVDMMMIDLNQDGIDELIVAEYGNTIGSLNSYIQDSNDEWNLDASLINQPGAIALRKVDMDNDGHEDLIVLFGQGDESVYVIYSRSNIPEIARLLRFPSCYGSSSIQVLDFDKDGHQDIITTNGDNLDYATRPKPYHGIRYYHNNGDNTFTETWYYPFDGAYDLEVKDFDLDGDYDIAAVAYFVNPLERTTQSFVYLEQQETGFFNSSLSFIPSSFIKPIDEHYICMTSGDIDNDGDIDILIGNTSTYLSNGLNTISPGPKPAYIVLENETR